MPPDPLPAARLLFSLEPGASHLNHGGFGAVPTPVQRAQQRLRDEMEANPTRFFTIGLLERLAHSRSHLASFLKADPKNAALVANATAGVNIALHSMRLRPGDEIVTTDHGYGSVDLAINQVCADTGAQHRRVTIPLDAGDDEIVEAVAAAVAQRTAAVIVDQVTSPTAREFPVNRIVAAVRARGSSAALIVDAAHAPGMLDVDVDSIDADFWVGNLHKWAFAPRGAALLAVSPRWRERTRPRIISWEHPTGFPSSIELQGTVDYTSWLAAPAGLHVMRTLGVDRLREHNSQLASYGQDVVAELLRASLTGVPSPQPPLSMALVPLPSGVATTRERAEALRVRISSELHAEVAVNAWRGAGLLRISAQVYNRPEEYERLGRSLAALLAA